MSSCVTFTFSSLWIIHVEMERRKVSSHFFEDAEYVAIKLTCLTSLVIILWLAVKAHIV
jgi:hypothetical protein